jgi:hypothetical protein
VTAALSARAYWCPKSSGRRAEWEDGFAISEPDGIVAVADGATWAPRSRQWARDLTSNFLAHHAAGHPVTVADFPEFVGRIAEGFDERWASGDAAGGESWWSGEVEARGAAAAFIGLHVDVHRGAWHALAVGDCCLFHFPVGGGGAAFPLTRPEQFNSSPTLISSKARLAPEDVASCGGAASVGDVFVLASDAISSWMTGEEVGSLLKLLNGIRSSNFGFLVEQLRGTGRMPDDDVTLVRVTVEGSGAA